MAVLDIEKLVAEANQHLKLQQKIHPEDPLLSAVTLQNVLLQAQVDFLNQKMEEQLHLFNVAAEQHREEAKQVAAGLITNAGSHLEAQLNQVVEQWEARLQKAGTEAENNLKQTAFIAKAGGLLLLISGAITFGMAFDQLLGQVLHH